VSDEDAAVDDRNLDAITRVGLAADLAPERRSPDLLRRRVHVEVVRDVGRYRSNADKAADPGGLLPRHLHGHRVQNGLVRPMHSHPRKHPLQP